MYLDYTGAILELYWGYLILGVYFGYNGGVFGLYLSYSGAILELYWGYQILGV